MVDFEVQRWDGKSKYKEESLVLQKLIELFIINAVLKYLTKRKSNNG